jgi:hypothetical protein
VDGDDRSPTSMPTSPSALAREFVRCVSAPLKTPILKAPPRCRTRRSPSSVTIHRSTRLAAKCASRAPNATLQAQKVLMSKWEPTASQPSDNQVVADFQRSFQGPLDSSKRAALRTHMKFDVTWFEEACESRWHLPNWLHNFHVHYKMTPIFATHICVAKNLYMRWWGLYQHINYALLKVALQGSIATLTYALVIPTNNRCKVATHINGL